MEAVNYKKPVCAWCGGNYTYARLNGTFFCRSCGYITNREGEKINGRNTRS